MEAFSVFAPWEGSVCHWYRMWSGHTFCGLGTVSGLSLLSAVSDSSGHLPHPGLALCHQAGAICNLSATTSFPKDLVQFLKQG